MMKYEIVKLPGASPKVVEEALNKRSKDGFRLEFIDSGWFILSKYDYDEDKDDEDKDNEDTDQEDYWVD